MDNDNFLPNSISHKELNALLKKASSETTSIDKYENQATSDTKEFNDLITSWTDTSQKILLMLRTKEQILTKNKCPKSLMAYGAMSAHINLALQALKASEFDH